LEQRLKDKTAIVTGAGSAGGIGAAIARRFVAEGACVLVCDIIGDRAQAVANSLGDAAWAWCCDVSQSDQVDAMVNAAVDRFGRLDIMVNNVGFAIPGFLGDQPNEHWDKVIAGNLSSTFYGMRAALRPMLAQRSGVIINISSAAGIGGAPGLGTYGAAKAGVISLTQTAAVENFKRGVRINCILPNAASPALLQWFDTSDDGRATRESIERYSRNGSPEETAAVAAFLAGPDSAYISGATIPVDGGLSVRVACVDATIPG